MRRRKSAPVFINVVEILLGVLDLRHGDDSEAFAKANGLRMDDGTHGTRSLGLGFVHSDSTLMKPQRE